MINLVRQSTTRMVHSQTRTMGQLTSGETAFSARPTDSQGRRTSRVPGGLRLLERDEPAHPTHIAVAGPAGPLRGRTEEANALASFMRELTAESTVSDLAERYKLARSVWSEYRSGQKLIPWDRLAKVVEHRFSRDPRARRLTMDKARRLHAAAAAAAQRPAVAPAPAPAVAAFTAAGTERPVPAPRYRRGRAAAGPRITRADLTGSPGPGTCRTRQARAGGDASPRSTRGCRTGPRGRCHHRLRRVRPGSRRTVPGFRREPRRRPGFVVEPLACPRAVGAPGGSPRSGRHRLPGPGPGPSAGRRRTGSPRGGQGPGRLDVRGGVLPRQDPRPVRVLRPRPTRERLTTRPPCKRLIRHPYCQCERRRLAARRRAAFATEPTGPSGVWQLDLSELETIGGGTSSPVGFPEYWSKYELGRHISLAANQEVREAAP